MQKFKFNKNNLPISIRSRLTPTDLQQLPELFLLEGELLEGSTEERKGCWGCVICYKSDCTPGICGCHNKKEERCNCISCKAGHKNGHNVILNFNRETPKVPKPLIPVEGSEFGKNSNAYKINQILAYLDSKENK